MFFCPERMGRAGTGEARTKAMAFPPCVFPSPRSSPRLWEVSWLLILSEFPKVFITLCSMTSQEKSCPLNPNRELHEIF